MAHYAFTQNDTNIASVAQHGNATDGYVQRTESSINFTATGLTWHQGAEDEGQIGAGNHIAFPVKTGVRNTYDNNGDPTPAYIGFKHVAGDMQFIRKCEEISREPFISGGAQSFGGDVDAAMAWLNSKGFWTNFTGSSALDSGGDDDTV